MSVAAVAFCAQGGRGHSSDRHHELVCGAGVLCPRVSHSPRPLPTHEKGRPPGWAGGYSFTSFNGHLTNTDLQHQFPRGRSTQFLTELLSFPL